jgi:hypothetical protein
MGIREIGSVEVMWNMKVMVMVMGLGLRVYRRFLIQMEVGIMGGNRHRRRLCLRCLSIVTVILTYRVVEKW